MELPSLTKENLELLTKFDDRTQPGVSGVQRTIERISAFFGSPAYFIFAVVFIFGWVALNAWGAARRVAPRRCAALSLASGHR